VVSKEYADSTGVDIYARFALETVTSVEPLLKDRNPE